MTASVVLFDGRSAAADPTWKLRLETAKQRSKFVRALRRALLLAILALAGGVLFFIVQSAINPPPEIDPAQVGGQVRMVNPRFTGRDSSGAPFVVSARSAERPETGSETTELASPRLDFENQDNPASNVQADRGLFDQVARTLDLIDGVSFGTANGYRFETQHARAYVDEGRVVGERVIMGEGPLGSIRAQSFEISEGGDRVVFTGDVVARLYPDRPPEQTGESMPSTVIVVESAEPTLDAPTPETSPAPDQPSETTGPQ
jgi:lipopolysaccharide export system protein LptC